MCLRYGFDAVNCVTHDFMQSQKPFGGKADLLSGDFLQVLSVIEGGHECRLFMYA